MRVTVQPTPGKPVRAVSDAIEIEVQHAPRPQPAAELVAAIRGVPKGWQCSLIQEPGKMGHATGLDEPAFRLDFTNPKETFTDNWRSNAMCLHHPSLRLDFYPLAAKERILNTIDAERVHSGEIPTYYAETQDYILVTSPAWINEGYHSEEAQKLLAPLEQALRKLWPIPQQGRSGPTIVPATNKN